MATCNFYSQDDFKLMAADFSVPVYPENEDGEEDTSADPIDYYFDNFAADEAQAKIDEINEKLRFYKLELKDGYYCGTQIFVNDNEAPDEWYFEKWFDFNDYGVNRYVLRRMVNAEKRRINDEFLPLFKDYGFSEYVVSARFSSGETWYKQVA